MLVDEYDGGVSDQRGRRNAVATMGDADLALLAGHGVFVLANSIGGVYRRAVALELAVPQLVDGRGRGGPGVPEAIIRQFGPSNGDGFTGYWGTGGTPRRVARRFILLRTGR